MAGRKIFCGVMEGVVYDDRCLFKLSQVLENNTTCESCPLREIEKMKSGERKRFDTEDERDTKSEKRRRRRKKRNPREKPNPIGNEGTIQTYSSKDLIELLGKSERTIWELAQKGKIPARKVGREWRFPKEEFNRWLSEKGRCTDIVPTTDGHSEDVRHPEETVEGTTGESLNKEDSEYISE